MESHTESVQTLMNWLRDRWPYLTYVAGIFMTLAALFIWVVPAAADAPSIAVHFISAREGYRDAPYLDSAGCITVGYGELLTCTADARLADYSAVTEAEAEAFLRQRVEEIIRRVDAEVTVELHDEQMAALVSVRLQPRPVGVRQLHALADDRRRSSRGRDRAGVAERGITSTLTAWRRRRVG